MSQDAIEGDGSRLLGVLRGGEQNTFIGRDREAQQEDTLAKVPVVLQNSLIEDLSKSIASATNGDGAYHSPAAWVLALWQFQPSFVTR